MPRAERAAGDAPRVLETKITREITLEPAPAPVESAGDGQQSRFFQELLKVTPREWADNERAVYVYRRFPQTVFPNRPAERGGSYKYLARLAQAFDLDDMKNWWGGGDFALQLNDVKTGMTIARAVHPIEGPPKLVEGEAMRSTGPGGQAAPAAPAAAPDGSEKLVDKLMLRVSELEEKLERDPSDAGLKGKIDEARELLALLQASTPRQSTTLELAQALKMVAELQQPRDNSFEKMFMEKALERLMNPASPAAASADPAEQIDKWLAIADRVAERMGKGSGGRRGLGEVIVENMPVILDKATGFLREAIAVSRTVNARRIPPGARVVYQAPPRAIQPPLVENPEVAAARGVAAVPPPEPGTAEQPVEVAGPSIEWVRLRLVEMIRQGTSGDAIVDWLEGCIPDLVRQAERASKAELEMFFRSDPVLATAMELPNFPATIREMYEYLHDEGGDDEDEGTADAEPAARPS